MIPAASIIAWQKSSPWPTSQQIEQDLILSRMLVELYSNSFIRENLIFRGGTALHKLFIYPSGRYSEDIDMVQINPGSIAPYLNAIRSILDPWLGEPTWKVKQTSLKLVYRFQPESSTLERMRIKIEINTKEHFKRFDLIDKDFKVDNPWFTGSTKIRTYCLEELLGTKLRALYQRKKGRDLYDLYLVMNKFPELNFDKILDAFQTYVVFDNTSISRAEFEANLSTKIADPAFSQDVTLVLSEDILAQYDFAKCADEVLTHYVSKIPGEAWKGQLMRSSSMQRTSHIKQQ
jgi:predicted nucleotidyltransferase component of viral defense system